MKSPKQLISLSILSLLHLLSPDSAQASEHFGVSVKGGLQTNEHYSMKDCEGCQSVPVGSGLNLGLEVTYRVNSLRFGALLENQGEVFVGPSQAFYGGILVYSHDYLRMNFNGGVEAGMHYIEEYSEFLGPYSVNNSDWALLPYMGLRADADILVWSDIGLRVGLWSALRADLSTLDQELLMKEGFLMETQSMQTYRAGGLQFAGGVKLGISI